MTDTDIQSKLAEYEGVVRMLTAKLEELVAENARLRSLENNAHSVLREVYNDPTASPAVRVKAAGLALPHETPRLAPVEAPLELVAELVIPLADVVARQRARCDRMLREDPRYLAARNYQAIELKPNGGNGSSDSSND
jgi:hypothetical protein